MIFMFKKLVPFLFVGFIALHSSAATASVISEIEANNTAATAQNVDGNFDFAFSADIGDITGFNTSTSLSHVSILGTGDGSHDWYSFESLGGMTILDIDNGSTPTQSTDTVLGIWDFAGNLVAVNDDAFAASGAGGSFAGLDSFIQINTLLAGDYFVGVCRFSCGFSNGYSIFGAGLSSFSDYTLHISTTTAPVPEPSIIALFGLGLVGIGFARRRRQS
jgi:hypothetical protein